MIRHSSITSPALRSLIRKGEITYAGNLRMKIYGTLRCRSGKRMKKENRVFFNGEAEAIKAGLRPCGNCMNKNSEKLIISEPA